MKLMTFCFLKCFTFVYDLAYTLSSLTKSKVLQTHPSVCLLLIPWAEATLICGGSCMSRYHCRFPSSERLPFHPPPGHSRVTDHIAGPSSHPLTPIPGLTSGWHACANISVHSISFLSQYSPILIHISLIQWFYS